MMSFAPILSSGLVLSKLMMKSLANSSAVVLNSIPLRLDMF